MKVTLANTIGAALLGAISASVLFGITMVQVYTYYQNFPRDWKFQKYAVALLLLLDILHAVFTIVAIYHYLINKFGDIGAVQYLSWSFKLQVALNVGIVLVVQSLYAWRVYRLGINSSFILPWLIIILVAAGCRIGIVLTVKTYATDTFASIHKFKGILMGVGISATTVDFAIATVICYYLQTNRTSFRGTNNKLVRIMRYVLICGFLTSACSLSVLITYATVSTNLIFIGIVFLLPHLYINSYLAMLNARNSIRNDETSLDMSNSLQFWTKVTQHHDQSETTNLDGKIHQNSNSLSPSNYQNEPQESGIAQNIGVKQVLCNPSLKSQSTERTNELMKATEHNSAYDRLGADTGIYVNER